MRIGLESVAPAAWVGAVSERWALSDGTVVTLERALAVHGTGDLAVALRKDLARRPLPHVGIGEHRDHLDPTDRASVAAWLMERGLQHGARLVAGYTPPARPAPPDGAVY